MSRRTGIAASLAVILSLSSLLAPLSAQTPRDTVLAQGRRAYEGVDYPTAARLLPLGLASSAVPRDSAWVSGVHMLMDALLDGGDSASALLWARWATHAVPAFPIDSNAFPPRVARILVRARTAVGAGASDTAVASTLEVAADVAAGKGQLRLARGTPASFAIVEGVGTILPGETRTLDPGVYTVRINADRLPALVASREVLPGFVNVLTPRYPRPAAPTLATTTTPGRPATPTPAAPPAPAGIRGSTLASSGATSCAVIGTNITCWGDNSSGQLGSSVADTSVHVPVVITGEEFRTVSIGATHACALTASAKAYCWGLGINGELGTGRAQSSPTPVAVSGGQVFVQIAAGGTHTCGLSRAGTVLCWGANHEGQLGNRTSAPSLAPTPAAMPAGLTFTEIVAGISHACALTSTGAVWCWGGNGSGQLGNGATSDANAPVLVQATVPFRSITAGGSHTCGLTAGGTAWCWGANASGQLGSGTAEPVESRPVTVTGGLTFQSVDAGEAHTCALTADGAAYCWGVGRAGQLGNGQSSDSPRPVLVIGGHVFRSLSLGINHSCGTTADSLTRCWGSNTQNQLGSLGGRGSPVPVPVLVRPMPRAPGSGLSVITSLRERFDDGDWTTGPSWSVDSASGARFSVTGGAVEVTRRGSHGVTLGAGLALPVRIPVTRATQIQFDVQVLPDSTRTGCGLNCASWPAVVRVRVRNSDLTESEVWYAFSDNGGTGHPLGAVVIVGKGDAPSGQWLREQRFTILDALPRAETIIQVSVGGIGGDFSARFDNIYLPVPVLASVAITPDSMILTGQTPSGTLRAAAKDAAGAELPWIHVSWSSADTSIVRVDSTGAVSSGRIGRTWVRASAGATTDSAKVVVRSLPPRGAPPRRPGRP